MSLPEVCVVYLIQEDPQGSMVLLGRKKTGLGLGKWVGPGGKLERGEDARAAAVREVYEEVGITVARADLVPIGELVYPFPHRPEWSQRSWAFAAHNWEGEAIESGELAPQWHRIDSLPLDEMWDDARQWLPQALRGVYVVATYTFSPNGTSTESERRDFS